MTDEIDEARVRDIVRVICRIPVERGQQVLYHLLLNADDRGVSSEAVRAARGFDQAQHRGLMSSLSGRVNTTRRELHQHDKPGCQLLLTQRWDGTQNWYRARPELRAAIDRIPALSARLAQPVEALAQAKTIACDPPPDVEMNPPQRPPAASSQGPPSASTQPQEKPFHALLGVFAAAGLHYPSSLVANFVLALQTKRFVILTGISGTGKTRIAQALAGRYDRRRPTVRAVRALDGRTLALTVKPYMLKFRRFILPKALAYQWPRLETIEGGGERVAVRWPGGVQECAVYARDAIQVVLSGGAWAWFSKQFTAPGGQLLVSLVGPEEAPTGLELRVAEADVATTTAANYAVVPVRPDWTDARGLLGYFNPITRSYVTTPFLQLLLGAADEAAAAAAEDRAPAPYFAVLDEMNLARVEHYFSDFLSAVESGEPIPLHDVDALEEGETEDAELLAVPKQVLVPPNLYIVGTVNVDESTYMFSPKVLDRAFTIELNDVDLETFGGDASWSDELDLIGWDGELSPTWARKPTTEDWVEFGQLFEGALRNQLLALHGRLADDNRHFGYRVANEIARFVCLAAHQSGDVEQAAWAALDLAILQKVLVKLHGTQQELSALLDGLIGLMLAGADGEPARRDRQAWHLDRSTLTLAPVDGSDAVPMFPQSAAKLWRMDRRLRERGFTAWIE